MVVGIRYFLRDTPESLARLSNGPSKNIAFVISSFQEHRVRNIYHFNVERKIIRQHRSVPTALLYMTAVHSICQPDSSTVLYSTHTPQHTPWDTGWRRRFSKTRAKKSDLLYQILIIRPASNARYSRNHPIRSNDVKHIVMDRRFPNKTGT